MVWAIDSDDFTNECSDGQYPLLKAINSAFKDAVEGGSLDNQDTFIPPRDNNDVEHSDHRGIIIPSRGSSASLAAGFSIQLIQRIYMLTTVMFLYNHYFSFLTFL